MFTKHSNLDEQAFGFVVVLLLIIIGVLKRADNTERDYTDDTIDILLKSAGKDLSPFSLEKVNDL